MYTCRPNVGVYNRYIAVHPYLVITSFLSSCFMVLLGGTNKEAKYLVLLLYFEALGLDVVDHMIAHCIES